MIRPIAGLAQAFPLAKNWQISKGFLSEDSGLLAGVTVGTPNPFSFGTNRRKNPGNLKIRVFFLKSWQLDNGGFWP
jgi:hypothetical protein